MIGQPKAQKWQLDFTYTDRRGEAHHLSYLYHCRSHAIRWAARLTKDLARDGAKADSPRLTKLRKGRQSA